ncbi:hypothetical protein DN062_00540 [Nitrincola tibetensis]|uniref:Uncharacterized protein n=1 Tax=Nitrincola tibetensis TaxID=2219697 RepID=A0A364NR93_9GAMM|nr:hypothetical protein [Nitrincola tibetensis]RAU19606.1 hypothetical protein DN062_00540 [Nitrincola tibetensis]
MKLGLRRDIRLFKIRWRRRWRSIQKSRSRKAAKTGNLAFSRAGSSGDFKQELCAMHEIGHMVLLHYLVPTKNITARVWKNTDGEWEGSTEPDNAPDVSDYMAKTFVAGFLAEQMACRVLSKLSYKECYYIFRTVAETNSDYIGFNDFYRSQFRVENGCISEFEYYVSIHDEVYSYFIRFGIKRMYASSRLLSHKGQIKYTDTVE